MTVDYPRLDGVWLAQIAGTTADHTLFPPDRTLPSLNFDFRDLVLDDPEPDDPFAPFRTLIDRGLEQGLRGRGCRHLVFVGHSFGGMAGMNYLLTRGLDGVQEAIPELERVTLVMANAAHTSPMDRYQIRSDAPVVGPLATWLSHHVTRVSTTSRRRMGRIKKLIGREPPKPLWREVWRSTDELTGVWNLPKASSLDHFWSVVRCANDYDIARHLRIGRRLWFDLLVLSGELDTEWPVEMFDEFWELIEQSGCPRARWCHFPGDDHLGLGRQPTKYYKEIKDFILASPI